MPPQLLDAVTATASVSIASFPGSRAILFLWLGNPTFETWFLSFACQTHTEKTTLPLAVLFRKIGLDMPQLAHVALPWRPGICVMLCAFATNAIFVVALPLASGESCRWLALCAG